MADVTVEELAATVKTPVERLLKQMADAGLPHTSGEESVSEQQKHDLLAHLRSSHGAGATLKPRGTISLKRRSVGTVKAVSQGRTGHKVKVEVMRRRTYVKPDEEAAAPASPAVREPTAAELEAQRIREQEQKRKEAEEEARRAAERKAEEAELQRQEEERRAQEEQAAKALKQAESSNRSTNRAGVEAISPEVAAAEAQAKVQATEKAGKRVKGKDRDRANRDGFGPGRTGRRELSLKSERRGRRKIRRAHAPIKVEQQGGEFKPTEFIAREVEVPEMITVGELAQRMTVKAGEVIKTLMDLGLMATINQAIDQDTATTVVEVMGHKVKLIHEDAMEQALEQSLRIEGEGESRPPVVTVMGHVDHGKTSLLDKIRHTRVVSGEAGGITQHIGAYSVDTDHGRICFIDTPGHAAFTAMRARGARVTDIVILVVAADDGVMPQTEEAIQHAKAADVPIVVAINKMDLESADPERVTKELAAKDVAPEAWGGDIQFVNVSAVTGEGLDSLLEAVLLQAEILELKAVPDASARGVVVESRLDRGRGPVSTILVQNGTLKRGDIIIAGEHHGRVRAMLNDQGEQASSAGPSEPVEVLGLNGTPAAGDAFSAVTDERSARELAEFRRDKTQEQRQAMQQAAKLDNMFASLGEGEKRVLKLVVKADVRGSLEAIVQALAELGNDEVAANVLGSGVGGITESDINLALTYGAAVFGFNVRADGAAKDVIESEGVDLRYYSVIYELIDDVRQVLSGMLAPEVREEILGVAEVRDVFNSPRLGQIAGCMVTEGTVHRNKPIRVLRDNVVIYEGELESLRRFKDDVTEVRHGTECGIG
ncbi:MAG: translation initiation factor IF-2, partial [Gammaproteobacteria bacterium]|nr:translation initiation factor IF-2 [Gammaproteobacteria bacterium]